jgi:hypothetical protein
MKIRLNFRFLFLTFIWALFIIGNSFNANAQKTKKNKIRLKVSYVKIMDGSIYFDVKAISRINKEYVDVPNIELQVTNEVGDSIYKLGSTKTNMMGKSKFELESLNKLKADTSKTYTINFKFKGDKKFKRASKSLSFKNANIKASIVKKDSTNYISATLIDAANNTPVSNAALNVQVQRLFKPLKIGKDFYITDEDGTILVSIPKDIPGIDGNLTFEVVLADSDNYGTVKAILNAPIGTKIVQNTDFYKREMWSSRDKTPLFLLIFPNLLTFGIWGIIIYLIFNLFKLSKS